MKTLTLIRHAKSSWDYEDITDFSRPLNDRGVKSGRLMGQDLHKQGISFDRIFSSGAVRAYHTAVLIAHEIGLPTSKIKTKRRLYQCSSGQLISFVQSRDNALKDVAIVGHYPSLPQAVTVLSHEAPDSFPTCAIARIEFDSNDWSKIGPGKGKLTYYQYPKNLPDFYAE